MKSRAGWLAFATALALGSRAWAETTFGAVLIGSNEVPGPGTEAGSFDAVVVLEGTRVSLTLTPKEVGGWMSGHIHRGAAGIAGRLVAQFPWDDMPRTHAVSVSAKVAAAMAAHPEKFYVDVHTPRFPAGAARGQLGPPVPMQVRQVEKPVFAPGTGRPILGSGALVLARTGVVPQNPGTNIGDDLFVGTPGAPGGLIPPDSTLSSPRRDQSIDFRSAPHKVYLDSDFRLDATSSSGLRVFFTGTGDCTVNGATVHILSAGRCWVIAHQPGDARFEAAPDVDQVIKIAKASQRIEGAPAPKTYLDPDFSMPMSATSGLSVVFFAWGDCTVNGSHVHITGAGSCSFTAHQPGDSNYLAAQIVDQQFAIAKADQTIDFAELPNPYYGIYDLPLNARASSGLPVIFSASGPCQVAGSSLAMLDSGECSVTAHQPGDRNFNAAPSVTRTFQVVVPVAPPQFPD